MRQRWASAGVLATVFLAGAAAHAQEGAADVARRDLIAQAEAAATAGDHARAVQLGERAAQLRITPTIQYFLAREHLALGHSVEALGYSGACARSAEADLTLRNRDGVLQACRDLVAETGRRVVRVIVHVPTPAPAGLMVRVHDAELPPTLYDIPYPVAPGVVVVEASAPGHLPFRRELQVAASQTALVDVRLEPAAVTPPVVAALPPVAIAPPPSRPPRPVEAGPRGPGVGPWIVAGTGATALILGGVFYALASGARDDRAADCVGGCSPVSEEHDARYVDFLKATNVALVVGGAALAGGVTWFLIDRLTHRESRPTALRLDLTPSAAGLTLGLGGRF
ncbi:MAG: hypothetical protein Q8S73_09940 [Deltaproteobacteria bacterium]|nr:hypothetical protein [Myxococcales bacterium]MDP3214413.1 hypothetical protein [Deltaproteobacteria bacterium]